MTLDDVIAMATTEHANRSVHLTREYRGVPWNPNGAVRYTSFYNALCDETEGPSGGEIWPSNRLSDVADYRAIFGEPIQLPFVCSQPTDVLIVCNI